MKILLRSVTLFLVVLLAHATFAQYTPVGSEHFETTAIGKVPSGWNVTSNTDVALYYPSGCQVTSRGLQTPGVGKNAPMSLLLPVIEVPANSTAIKVQFTLFVFDANMKCGTQKPFPCATAVDAFIVPATFNNPDGDINMALAQQPAYQLVNPNGANSIVFSDLHLPAGERKCRVLVRFKSVTNNCTSTGTKFVFDDFNISGAACPSGNCAPVTNNDYFHADRQGWSLQLQGNVFGGFAPWASVVPETHRRASLPVSPAVNGGEDVDMTNPPLSSMQFRLVDPLKVVVTNGCPAGTLPGTLQFNANGTFTYTAGASCVQRVSFGYEAVNSNTGLVSKKAVVTIDNFNTSLPVRWNYFNAARSSADRQQVDLAWETATEQNNKGFYIQRKTDGDWQDIGLVFSATESGNSSLPQQYRFKDRNIFAGNTQYRLMQVDLDGKVHYSEVKAIAGEDFKTGIFLFPNPVTGGKVTVLFPDAALRDILLTDMNGRILRQQMRYASSTLTLQGLGKGIYTLKAVATRTGVISMEKFIVH